MDFKNLSIERRNDIFIITLRKPPENRLDVRACQELINAYRCVESDIGQESDGAVILRGSGAKYFCTGLDLDERDQNPYASTDGFYPLLATVLDFPFPTIALINGHVMGGACLLTLAHDYRIMNPHRGWFQMPPVNAGLHHPGMGTLLRTRLSASVLRKVLLEAHKYDANEALEDGIVDAAESPGSMLDVAMQFAEKCKAKAKMGVYGVLRNELVGEATAAYQSISYVHHRPTTREPKMKL